MAADSAAQDRVVAAVIEWLAKARGAKTPVCVALLLARRIREKYPLTNADIDTGGGQVAGLSGPMIRGILAAHGIEARYASEGGRTTRSSLKYAWSFLAALDSAADLSAFSDKRRREIARAIEDILIAHAREQHFARQKLQVHIDLAKPGPGIIEDILLAAMEKNLGGAVAQHLVGAKLARRFPQYQIENYPFTAADEQLGREADFMVANAAFHVTVAPKSEHLRRCMENLTQGRQPYLIVPSGRMDNARAFADELDLNGRTAIIPLDIFVGQNVAEMGAFDPDIVKAQIAAVLREYNRRVAEAESNPALQIAIPRALADV